MNDNEAMQLAIDLSRKAGEHGNHPFGSVIVMHEQVVAEGENAVETERDPSAHAETVAIREACQRLGTLDLGGATIYASGEPCWMCSAVIRNVGISRVVFAIPSGWDTGGYTSSQPIMIAGGEGRFGPPPDVTPGLMEAEARAVVESFGWSYRPSRESSTE
jgi:tRNA(adenine34) deaminase